MCTKVHELPKFHEEGIIKKISYDRRDYESVARRKEPILLYVPKNDDKKNAGSKGLNDP